MRRRNLLGEWESIRPDPEDLVDRFPVPGGWVLVFETAESTYLVGMPDPNAPHCRPRPRWFQWVGREGFRSIDVNGKVCVVRILDDRIAEFPTIAEAHDALGENSLWVEVTDAAE